MNSLARESISVWPAPMDVFLAKLVEATSQKPPTLPLPSRTAIFKPALCSSTAALRPLKPAPTTSTSTTRSKPEGAFESVMAGLLVLRKENSRRITMSAYAGMAESMPNVDGRGLCCDGKRG